MLSAESWSNVQQRPWTLHGILLDLHFFYQTSPFSVTSLPMISFSFLSIYYIYCGPLMQAQSQPRTATFYSLVQLKQQSLWPPPLAPVLWWLKDTEAFPVTWTGRGVYGSLSGVDYPCPDEMREYRQICFSYYPVYLSLLLKCFKYIQLLPILIYFKTPHIHDSQGLFQWKRHC